MALDAVEEVTPYVSAGTIEKYRHRDRYHPRRRRAHPAGQHVPRLRRLPADGDGARRQMPDGVTRHGSDDAKENAKEALSAYLESIDSRKLKVPAASEPIEPETGVGFAIWLKQRREAMGMSQSEVAEQLGIAYQTYQRIEDPARSNPTLKTILKLEKVFDHRLVHLE